MNPRRCISLWQPWATLVVIGAKCFETRPWATDYRGPLLIHAAKRWTSAMNEMCIDSDWHFRRVLEKAGYISTVFRDEPKAHLPLGVIVGCVRLVAVHRTEDVRNRIGEQEHQFGDYRDGRFAWELEAPRLFETPIPLRGFQRFFNVPDHVVSEVLQ